jgi:hypothetical protein
MAARTAGTSSVPAATLSTKPSAPDVDLSEDVEFELQQRP